jgi:hypothetical protein
MVMSKYSVFLSLHTDITIEILLGETARDIFLIVHTASTNITAFQALQH